MQCKVVAPLCAALLALAARAEANPRPLPFTYTSETLREGEAEVEQFVDGTPVRARNATTGNPAWFVAMQLQTELEYGITNRLELGLYVTWVPAAGSSFVDTPTLTEGNGVKQRLRYQFAEPGEWPVDVGVYGELVENEREFEIEAKILLQRRIGRLRVAANLWGEREFYWDGRAEWVLNPTLGVTYAATANLHLGVEGWMRAELPHPSPKPFAVGPHAFVGPTVLLDFGRVWWSTGVYLRATDTGRSPEVGDPYGRVWVRTILGLSL